jgi:maltose O-acetyltransferase
MAESMSEKQKMLAGQLYLGSDPELAAGRRRARQILREYNAAADDQAKRGVLLGSLFGEIGPGVLIEPAFSCDYGTNIVAGKNLFVNFNCVFLDCAAIRIGDNVQLGPAVQILTAHHPVDPIMRRDGRELASPVTIGDDVWIGGGAVICPGVTIGSGSTIGAGSVVTRDVPALVVAAGNPCRVIRRLD